MKTTNFIKNSIQKIVLLTMIFTSSLSARDIYVSKNGNDSNQGTKDSPFKTIAKASSLAKAGDVVIIGAGTYEELLQPKNSGSPGNPIIYRAKAGEKVIITAMQAINNWTSDQGNIYKATVNWDLGQDNMALHNDQLMDLARWPNNVPQNLFERDYLPACNRGAAGGGKTWMNYNGSQSNGHARSIPYASKWKNGGSIHFYGGAGFLAWTDYITNSSSNRIDFKLQRAQNWIQLRHHPGYTGHGVKKGEFFLQGIKEALDYKNEWFYDKKNKTLYVQIDGGGAPANNSIRFRRRTQTIKLNKNYIHIENLAVFGGSIDISGNNNKLYKVSSFYGNHTLGVINGFDSRRQSVLMTGNKNTVEQCEIAWGAGNGVYDKGSDNRLLNSYVHDFNYLGNYDCVLNTRGATRGKYRNNTLTRSGKDIIQGYVNGGEFAYNDISWNNFVADDGGLLYTTNARSTKSSIHHNTFHDSQAREGRFKGTGIYLDNDSKNWDVYNNVVWNTKWTNIQINWNGTNLNIFNNTFAKGSATMGAWHKAGTRFSNVKVWNNITDKEAVDQQGNQESESTWEPQSNKQNNLVSKASFKNYNNNDYTLKAGAQAIDYGRVISGYTDGHQGSKPDAGAYEFGVAPFKTGVNWNIDNGPTGLGCYGLPGEETNCTNTGPSAPSISFKTPTDGTQLDAGSSILVDVNATDADGSIAYVELFLNGELIRKETSTPYQWGQGDQDPQLKNLTAGQYKLKAVAHDNDGNSTPSEITVTVNGSNTAPIVSFITPQDATQLDSGSSIFVDVNASDADGTIAYVELFLNGELIRKDSSAPYQWGQANQDPQLKNLTAGQYKLKAVAHDNDGNSTPSEITVTVNGSNTAPIVSFTTPQDATQLDPGSSVFVDVKATDADGSIAYVELFLNDQFIRRENVAPYEWGKANQDNQLKNLAVGEYKLKAVAHDNEGTVGEAIITVTVSNPVPDVDTVMFNNAPTTIEAANSYTFNVNYEASTNREIVVEFWSSTNWIAQEQVVVAKGTGVKTIIVNLPSMPNPGTGFVYKTHIRPLNTTWREALDRDQVNGVTVNAVRTQLIPDGTYTLESALNNQRLISRALENHSAVMHDPENFDDQKWVFTHIEDDVYTIMNKGTIRYLEVPYGACARGSNVATWTNAHGAHKKWKVIQNGNGIYSIKPAHCLSTGLDRAGGRVNANVLIWTYSSENDNQKWKIIPATEQSKLSVTREIASFNVEKLIITPNPVQEVLRLHNVNNVKNVRVFDMKGQMMLSKKVNKDSDKIVDVSGLNSGVYFISIDNLPAIKFLKK